MEYLVPTVSDSQCSLTSCNLPNALDSEQFLYRIFVNLCQLEKLYASSVNSGHHFVSVPLIYR